ncbi:MAG TPA: hypothetical protein VIG25_17240 [Pyrinomonadaceae bacterium]|jgi:hypothetical protein
MNIGSLIIASAAFAVSTLSFYFARKSWRESNRPLITVRTTSFDSGGNVGTTLSLLVENTGNRPAKNIRLTVDPKVLESALAAESEDALRKRVEMCFSDRGVIPILANGRNTSNGFGWLSADDKATWKEDARFEINVSYDDLDGRHYKHTNPLLIADDAGFAGSYWSDPQRN